jgi:hypothetical protein
VKRNLERFPEDFMFQLSKEEWKEISSQIAITSADGKVLRSQIASIKTEGEVLSSQNASIDMRGRHVKYMPYAFTESGIAMLSGVLRSPQAVSMNIQIMRAFVAMRRFLASHAHPNLSKRTTSVRLSIVRKKCQTQPKKCQTRPKK